MKKRISVEVVPLTDAIRRNMMASEPESPPEKLMTAPPTSTNSPADTRPADSENGVL